MGKNLNMFTGGVLVVVAAGLVGCSQGFESQGKISTNGAQAVDISSEMSKAEEANNAAMTAIAEANNAVKELTDSKGNINVGLFSKSSASADVTTQGLLDGIINKLRPKFDQLFAKVTAVKAKFAEARALLAAALAKLDPANPAHAAMIQEIMGQMAKIDSMERTFSASMHQLASKLDLVVMGIEKLVSGVTSFIPGFGWIADLALDYFVMGDIKNFIAEIKMRLMAL